MKRFAAVLVLLAAVLPAMAESGVKEVADSWRVRLDRELPDGTPRAAVADWARRNSLAMTEGNDRSHVILPLGYFKEQAAGSFSSSTVKVCDGWGVSAEIGFNRADELVSRRVRTLGNCL
jgi:hypothetical protein